MKPIETSTPIASGSDSVSVSATVRLTEEIRGLQAAILGINERLETLERETVPSVEAAIASRQD